MKRVNTKHFVTRPSHGGLAAIFRGGSVVVQVPIPDGWKVLYPHVQLLWCSCQGDGFYVANCYLPSGGSKHSDRVQLLESLFSLAATFSNFPVFLCGDFQEEPSAYPPIQSAMLAGEWADVYSNQQTSLGLPVEASFAKCGWKSGFGLGSGKTRIDYVLSNRKATCLFQSVRYVRGCSFPGHTPVLCSLNVNILSDSVWVLKPHPKWTLPDKPTSDEEWARRESLCQPVFELHADALLEAASQSDVEGTWNLACRIATEMLNHISQQVLPSTRGSLPGFRKVPLCQDESKPCKFSKAHKIARCKRLLRELLFKASHWQSPDREDWHRDLYRTVRNLCSLLVQLEVSGTVNPSGPSQLWDSCNQILVSMRKYEDDLLRSDKEDRLRAWRKKLQISSRSDKKEVHRWLKGFGSGPPKFFKLSDGSFTASPNVMLSMIEDHMQDIYSHHADVDPADALEQFMAKYGDRVESIKVDAELPHLNHKDLFKLFQKRSADKASGLDGWTTRELLQLPPVGWIGFCLSMQIAEAAGSWPQVLRMISVTNIAKKTVVSSPEDTRSIGISSAIYSTWSSLRFKQLRFWMNRVCPINLLGGLAGRSADLNELELSLELHDPSSYDELVAVFLDRWKCFDLVLPHVAMNIAGSLGLPQQIVRATLGFYHNQVKFFKLGTFFGKKVLCTNSAVQGCSMSVLMINSMFAVLSSYMTQACPSIKFSTFLDDSKIWTRSSDINGLVEAFQAIEGFDTSIGQALNVDKTIVATRRKKAAHQFLLKVGRACKFKRSAKSLGFSHQFGKKRSPCFQDERVLKAKSTMARIAQLPLDPTAKAVHVHANGHSKWVHGSEIQGPSAKALRSLRTATAKVFHNKRNSMRCPFMLFATLHDPWLDPFAKWVQFVMLKLRRFSYLHPDLVREILTRVRNSRAPTLSTANGIVAVVSYLFAQLQWQVRDPENFLLELADGQLFCIKNGSKDSFLDELSRDVRRYLINKSPQRYDNPTPGTYKVPDVYLTRFILDTNFSRDEDFACLRKYIGVLPGNIAYTRALLSALISGSIYNGHRYKAAGLRTDACCPHCGTDESHIHMFCECQNVKDSCPTRGDEPLMSWLTGIIFEPTSPRPQTAPLSQWVLPTLAERWQPCSEVFVDGSVFHHKWSSIRAGAASVVVPGQFKQTVAFSGSSVNSFRCELFALILAIHVTEGDITIASDCASVLRRADFLKARGFQWDCTFCFENPDLWDLFLHVARNHQGSIRFIKVKAHTDGKSSQPSPLTEGNEAADALAKSTAKTLSSRLVADYMPSLHKAVELQVHLVTTLIKRSGVCELAPFDEADAPMTPLTTQTVCTCKPLTRLFSKRPRKCYKACHLIGHTVLVGEVEDKVLAVCRAGQAIPNHLMHCLRQRYVSFFASVSPNVVHFYSHPEPDFNVLVTGRSRISNNAAQALASFLSENRWDFSPTADGPRTTWLSVLIEFLSIHGFFPGWLTSGMSASILISRFRSRFVKLCKANSISLIPASHIRTAASFGMRNLSGFYGSALCKNIQHQLFVFLQAGLFCNQCTPDGSRLSTKWVPDLSQFRNIPCYQ